MSDPQPLPDLPGTITLDQARATVRAFGYKLMIVQDDPPKAPPGFAPTGDDR
jgi:hypothetical protein